MKIIFAVAIVVIAVFIFYCFFILPRKIDKAIKKLYRHPGEEKWQQSLEAITRDDNIGQVIKVAYNTPESQEKQRLKNLLFGKKAGVSAGS